LVETLIEVPGTAQSQGTGVLSPGTTCHRAHKEEATRQKLRKCKSLNEMKEFETIG